MGTSASIFIYSKGILTSTVSWKYLISFHLQPLSIGLEIKIDPVSLAAIGNQRKIKKSDNSKTEAKFSFFSGTFWIQDIFGFSSAPP
jgi:hypothetical protein